VFNMIKSATCECSFEIENTQHILLDCPRDLYNNQRATLLRQISAFGNINLNELLEEFFIIQRSTKVYQRYC